MYWGRAAHRPLNIRPDIDDYDIQDERIGPKFLWEFEQAKRTQIAQNRPAIKNSAHQASSADGGQTITQNGSAIENAADEDNQVIQVQADNGESLRESKQLGSVA